VILSQRLQIVSTAFGLTLCPITLRMSTLRTFESTSNELGSTLVAMQECQD
jgi:hypothetical protein